MQALANTSATCSTRCSLIAPSRLTTRRQPLSVVHSTSTQGEQGQDQQAAALKNVVSTQFQYRVQRGGAAGARKGKGSGNALTDFITKVQIAWRIFFPEQSKELTPKEEVKRRLRMVLVADRCGMSPASLSEMKRTIVKALQDFVDIEGEEGIEVSITNEPGLGTVYSVNIPVRRVKAESRFGPGGGEPSGEIADGVTLEWDPADYDSNPAGRFPMGC